MIIAIIRLILLIGVIYWTGYYSLDIAMTMFDASEIIKVDGVLNIAGVYGVFLLSIYLLIWWLNQLIAIPFPIGDINKVILVILLVITPILTIGTYTKIHKNIESYVECSELRKFSSRYSSRTYATSTELCQQLSQDK